MKRYNPKEIEPKWQQKWADDKIYEAEDTSKKPKRYILEYFPYPSGAAMHVGHVRNYTIGDALSRHARMDGANVLHPMGWDAFGLPAENYAIKTGISPQEAIKQNTGRFKQQLTQMGFGYDWSREFASSDPDYYKWTQWFFLLLYKRGLAYQKESLQWWCPVDKTVLANEQVENGRCWRCGSEVEKKSLKQWFFKITDYADRLAKDLDEVDWSDGIKSQQRNWIGRKNGINITYKVTNAKSSDEEITVFTTRPDTNFGATFVVLAPEHPFVQKVMNQEVVPSDGPSHWQAVEHYVQKALAKSELERKEEGRLKTGAFTGFYVTNPLNDTKLPIWVSDFVLAGFGTGAVVGVPAHDRRDFEFAKEFKLPIRYVVAPEIIDTIIPPQLNVPVVDRLAIQCIIKHPTEDKYLVLKKLDWETDGYSFVTGGIENGDIFETAKEEMKEETGYIHLGEIREVGHPYFVTFYHEGKKVNRRAYMRTLAFQLKDLEQVPVSEEEKAKNEVEWVSFEELKQKIPVEGCQRMMQLYESGEDGFVGEDSGIMINSGPLDGLDVHEATEKMMDLMEEKGMGRRTVSYSIRDWLISRQRYWGAPIPMIHCPNDGIVPVPEDQLPVVLPEMKSYEPSGDGRSPLARVPEFVNVTCPKCSGPAERETDTMDGFACSSWYFLRFADPHNNEKAFDDAKVKYWLPVDDYIGGAEHAVMHLLYARMWTKVMFDAGLIEFNEPFARLRNHGMILAPDGRKMSKSFGNVIAPDELIDQGYGADCIRIMELFIGPWNQTANWSVEGMGGSFRFLQRVWALVQEFTSANSGKSNEEQATRDELLRVTHRTIKKVSEDLGSLSFNTAIAAMMEAVNEFYKVKEQDHFANAGTWRFAVESLLQLLAPFAPHITEELWQQLGHEESIHISEWPKYDEKYLVSDTVTIVVQVNGKVRAQLEMSTDADEGAVVAAAKANDKVQTHIEGKEIVKTVYVPGKLLNIVIG